MSETRSMIHRQVRRVRRRLLLRALAQAWLLAIAGGLALTALAFLVRPFLFPAAPPWLTWVVPASLVAMATFGAVIYARQRAPSFVASALALDQAFGLKERVTTFCTLTPETAESPAGKILVEDVGQRVASLDVPGRFPVRVAWKSLVWPLGAAALAVAASFFDPTWSGANTTTNSKKINAVSAKEIQQQIENLRKVSTNKEKDELKTEKLKELEDAWNKLLDKQLDASDREKVRERANEMRTLEDKIKDRVRDLKAQAERNKEINNALNELAKDLAKTADKGPMKDLNDALAKNDLDKAQHILDQLAKDLANDKLTKEEQKDLAAKMKDFQEKLGKLANQKEQKEKLRGDRKEAQKQLKEFEDKLKKLTDQKAKDEIKRLLDEKQRELDQMENELENLDELERDLQDLQDLADALEQCEKCLGKGDKKGAQKNLQKALEKLKEIKLTEKELRELMEQQEALEEARLAMLQACQEGH